MNALQALLRRGRTLVMPGVFDALSARLTEQAGFEAISIGGNAIGATQLALPDIGLQSFGEFRDSVARVRAGSGLPCLVDGEDGYGNARMVVRTVRAFEQLGVDAMFFEDLVPMHAGHPPAVIALDDMLAKLDAALHARQHDATWIVGRTDAAHVGQHDEVVARARQFERLGVDAVLAFGLRSLEDIERLRDAVSLPLIVVVVENRSFVAPSLAQLNRIGIDMAVYPTTLLSATAGALHAALEALPRNRSADSAEVAGAFELSVALEVPQWKSVADRAEAFRAMR